MENLQRELNSLIKASAAESTWKTYKTVVESLSKFRTLYGFSENWPVSIDVLLHYIAYLSCNGFSSSTVTTYISAISHFHKLNGFYDHTKSFLVIKAVEGFRRKTPKRSDIRVPISLSLLKKLIGSLTYVCKSSYESSMSASAFSLAFFGFLRVGEFTADKKSECGSHIIQFEDFSFVNSRDSTDLHLNIRSSKTDQTGAMTTLIICSNSDRSICPVRLLQTYLNIRHRSLNSPLYIHFDGSFLSRYQFCSVLQRALSFCKIPDHIRSHSFRIGAATEASLMGISDEVVKKWGRWSSGAFRNYIRF